MLSKNDLGTGYLMGTGLALFGVLLIRLFLFPSPSDPGIWMGTITGSVLSLSLVYAGIWLWKSTLTVDQVWIVAKWAAVGLAVLTLLSTPVILRLDDGVFLEQNILINNLAAGGVTGTLFGLVIVLQRERARLKEVNQQKAVLNRVLRHNIRNAMNVIVGFAIDIEHETSGEISKIAQGIERKALDVVNLSDAARQIESLAENDKPKPMNISQIVRGLVTEIEESHPYVQIDLDIEPDLWVDAGELIGIGIENVIENAIKHNKNPQPFVSITVAKSEAANRTIEVCVTDDGPGIPESVLSVINQGQETKLDHLDGVGLWVAKWIFDSYGGEIEFQENEPFGSIVIIRIPMAQSQVDHLKRVVPSGTD